MDVSLRDHDGRALTERQREQGRRQLEAGERLRRSLASLAGFLRDFASTVDAIMRRPRLSAMHREYARRQRARRRRR